MSVNLDGPGYSNNIALNAMMKKLGEEPIYSKYGVCITNATEKHVKWKYDGQWKFIIAYETTLDNTSAKELKEAFTKLGIKDLLNDPIGECENDCKNVFIRQLHGKEDFQEEYPEGK